MYDQAQNLREIVQQRRNPAPAPKTRVITVTSGKGGVGKSSFSVNLAIALAGLGKRVLIIDADFGLANVDVMLGVTSRFDLTNVISGEMQIRDIILTGHAGVQFISGGSGALDLINLSEMQLLHFVNSLLQLEGIADIIIFDTGAGVTDNILRLIRSSTEAIIVTTPEPTAIMDAYALVKIMRQSNDLPLIRLLVNKAYSPSEGQDTLNSFLRIANRYMQLEINPLGFVLQDSSMSRAVRLQSPILVSFPKSVAAQNIQEIAAKLCDIQFDYSPRGGIRSFLERMLPMVRRRQ